MASPVQITGELTADAEVRYTPGANSHAILFLQIKASKGFPFFAHQDCGAEVAHFQAAEAKSRLLRRGMTVTVYAGGLTPRTDHGTAALRLEDVSDVIPTSINPREHTHAQ